MEYLNQSYYCKEKLRQYADRFSELVRILKPSEEEKPMDREGKLESFYRNEDVMLVRSNLDEVAKIMTQLSSDMLLPRAMEKRKYLYLRRALRSEGILLYMADVIDREKKKEDLTLLLSTKKDVPIDSCHVANIVSVLLEREYIVSPDSPGFVTKIPQPLQLIEQAGYVALTGYARATKDMEQVSGDGYSFLETAGGMLHVLLSDGTGSGEAAAGESDCILDLMEKFLEIQYPTEGALRLINGIWNLKQDKWKNPTLDICSINLNEGNCRFYKVGAAISFIKHQHRVEPVEGSCLPIGCFGDMDICKGNYDLEPGDTLIMISDGILGGYMAQENENDLCEFIERLEDISPGEMAQKILQSAIFHGKGEIKDDMTVLAVRLESRGVT